MNLILNLSTLALRQLVDSACATVGIKEGGEAAVKVAGVLYERFHDQSQRLTAALQNANARAWRALEISLAGDSWWERCKAAVARAEDKAFAQQVRTFLDTAKWPELANRTKFREQCLAELRAARKAGCLSGEIRERELAEKVADFARFSDPLRLLDAEWQMVDGMALALKPKYANLAWLLTHRPKDGGSDRISILVAGVRYFFRRAVEEDEKLARGLTFAQLDHVGRGQQVGFAKLEHLTKCQEAGFAALHLAISQGDERLEKLLGDVHAVVVETHTDVRKLHGKIDGQSVQLHQVLDLLRSGQGSHQQKSYPYDGLSIQEEFAEWQRRYSSGGTSSWMRERVAIRLSVWKTAAEQGVMEAQVLLGDCYFDGIGVVKDYSASLRCWLPAAHKGVGSIAYLVAVLIRRLIGSGSSDDEAKAFPYYLTAASSGYAKAFLRTGVCYLNGIGTAKEIEKALYWLRRSAEEARDEEAAGVLGDLYREGKDGFQTDLQEALKWYQKANRPIMVGMVKREIEEDRQKQEMKARVAGRFQNNRDNTITDHKHGLMWIKSPELVEGTLGQFGTKLKLKWDKAVAICRILRVAGHSDWRLPTVPEWQSLFDDPATPPHSLFSFVNGGDYYWTASEDLVCKGNAWQVRIWDTSLKIYSYGKGADEFVVAVRSLT